MFMFKLQNKNHTINFYKGPDGKITHESDNKTTSGTSIDLIKFFRDSFNSSLVDTRQFVLTFMNALDTLHPKQDVVKSKILEHIQGIDNPDDLMDILGFVRNTIDHPSDKWNKYYNNDSQSPKPFIPAKLTIEELDK